MANIKTSDILTTRHTRQVFHVPNHCPILVYYRPILAILPRRSRRDSISATKSWCRPHANEPFPKTFFVVTTTEAQAELHMIETDQHVSAKPSLQ